MPENKKAELDKTPTQVITDEVRGLLEGFGQAIREVLMGRNIGELVGMWMMSLISVKLVATEIQAFLQSDENLIRLKHDQRLELLGLLTENTEAFLSACKVTLQECYAEILGKGEKVYQYLAEHDKEWAVAVQENTTEVHAETETLKKQRQAMSPFSPLSLIGKRFRWFPYWYQPFAIEEVS